MHLYLLPNDKILDQSKLKAFAGDKMNASQKNCNVDRKHCGKRRKCLLPVFYPFPIMFSKSFLLGIVNSHDCLVNFYSDISWFSTNFIYILGDYNTDRLVFIDHLREVMKVVSYSRRSLNAGCIRLF